MLFHVLTVVVSSLVPGVAATLITLRVCAVENASASSCDENTDGENTDGENTLGLNTDGENTLGLNTEGAYSAVSLRRSDAVALAGVNCLANVWPMSLNTARS